jgi:hypothetical protein
MPELCPSQHSHSWQSSTKTEGLWCGPLKFCKGLPQELPLYLGLFPTATTMDRADILAQGGITQITRKAQDLQAGQGLQSLLADGAQVVPAEVQ